MKKATKLSKSVILFFSVSVIILMVLSLSQHKADSSFPLLSEIFKFRSDIISHETHSSIYSKNLSKEDTFLAYSSYPYLPQGEYTATFHFNGSGEESSECILEIVSEKGSIIEMFSPITRIRNKSSCILKFTITEKKEIEPRVKYINGSKNISLEKVIFTRTKNIFPVKQIILKSLYLTPIFFLPLLSLFFIHVGNDRWKLILSAFLTYTGIFLIIKFAWMSEDALITLRHVDNFIAGHGAVFNIGERVEGYTHTLWFWIISMFRAVGLSPKGTLVIPGILFSGAFLYLMFFVLWRNSTRETSINFGGALLIGISSFIDFGTSGLETSLSYLLLAIFAILISKELLLKKPILSGFIVTIMIFTRPDFGIFLIFGFFYYLFYYLKKRIKLNTILLFFISSISILTIYEIFRMGYYGAIFPNPFYAKSGSSSYFSQGIHYLGDLLSGSSFSLIIMISLLAFLTRREGKDLSGRIWILTAAFFYGFFVIRGGGDFMHGRFLLPTVILIAASSSGAFDNIFDKTKLMKTLAVLIVILSVIISRSIIPIQKMGGQNYHNGIADERFAFYGDKIFPMKDIFKDNHIFMWKTIGENYRFLTEKIRKKIKVAYHTVGFLGYYSGPRVNVLDRLGLTDPFVARRKIIKRGRPGHEKSAPFGYLIFRELTFGDTPFKLWNKLAKTQFGIIWDISRSTLNKFSFFLDKNFKSNLDKEIVSFLHSIRENKFVKHSDFLFFLKKFWYPYSNEKNKILFDSLYNKTLIKKKSQYCNWIATNRGKIETWDKITKSKLTNKRFFKNIIFAIKNIFK